jgi:FlaG/FlaF family flagellin (archaellin)
LIIPAFPIYFVWLDENGSFMTVVLAVKVNCPFGNNRAITGVIKVILMVAETVIISPGPPALVEPPFTLDT